MVWLISLIVVALTLVLVHPTLADWWEHRAMHRLANRKAPHGPGAMDPHRGVDDSA